MKKISILAPIAIIIALTSCSATQSEHHYSRGICTICGSYKEYKAGDKSPSGGIIIYDCTTDGTDPKTNGWRYLEVSPVDNIDAIFGFFPEHEITNSSENNGKTLANLLSGKAYTSPIQTSIEIPFLGGSLNMVSGSTEDFAAGLCDRDEYRSFRDWFLPSEDQLSLAMTVAPQLFADGPYWTSTEIDSNTAMTITKDGKTTQTSRGTVCHVKSVRAF